MKPMKKVMVFGTFDLLHPGHLSVLQQAGKRGDTTVIVARDRNVERIKGVMPTEREVQRMSALQSTFPDYMVQLGDLVDFLTPVREVRPDLILLGYDQKLPPGVTEADLAPATIERLPAHEPERFKSSLMRPKGH